VAIQEVEVEAGGGHALLLAAEFGGEAQAVAEARR
jgi:hypothetical protein